MNLKTLNFFTVWLNGNWWCALNFGISTSLLQHKKGLMTMRKRITSVFHFEYILKFKTDVRFTNRFSET